MSGVLENKTYSEYLEIITNAKKLTHSECSKLDNAIEESNKLIKNGNGRKTGNLKEDGYEFDDLILKLNDKFHYLKSDPLYTEQK